MNPFYFGERDHQLFGIYYPAQKTLPMRHGILLCPPVGQEYMRSYMAHRQLAIKLAGSGFDVLKFDYFGVGDSSGTSEDGNLHSWRDNIHIAFHELKDISGVDAVSVVGLRLGATLALLAAGTGLAAQSLLLWDPVVKGAEYIGALRELTAKLISDKDHKTAGFENLVGFPFSMANVARLSALDLLQEPVPDHVDFIMVTSESKSEFQQLSNHLGSSGKKVEEKNLAEIYDKSSSNQHQTYIKEAGKITAQWSDPEEFNQALIAHYAIDQITSTLTARYA